LNWQVTEHIEILKRNSTAEPEFIFAVYSNSIKLPLIRIVFLKYIDKGFCTLIWSADKLFSRRNFKTNNLMKTLEIKAKM